MGWRLEIGELGMEGKNKTVGKERKNWQEATECKRLMMLCPILALREKERELP